jgi:hypothetical protein
MKAMRAGLGLPGPGADHGAVTFADWLEDSADLARR